MVVVSLEARHGILYDWREISLGLYDVVDIHRGCLGTVNVIILFVEGINECVHSEP